jgi:hypothetical protein
VSPSPYLIDILCPKETTMKTETTCCNCRKALDATSAAYATKYAYNCRDGVLGACCAPRKGSDDDGWGDAPRHGYDY